MIGKVRKSGTSESFGSGGTEYERKVFTRKCKGKEKNLYGQ